MKRYKCSQLPPSVEGHYVYIASDVDARFAELEKYLRALVAQCENDPEQNVPVAGCVCKVCDLAREAALVASSL